MQIFIQLSNEYSYKSLCWPNVTSQRQTSLTVKKTITLPSTTDSQTLWIHLANCPASYTHQKRSPTMNWWKYTMHIPQRSITSKRDRFTEWSAFLYTTKLLEYSTFYQTLQAVSVPRYVWKDLGHTIQKYIENRKLINTAIHHTVNKQV